jgi:hypothetical protein
LHKPLEMADRARVVVIRVFLARFQRGAGGTVASVQGDVQSVFVMDQRVETGAQAAERHIGDQRQPHGDLSNASLHRPLGSLTRKRKPVAS